MKDESISNKKSILDLQNASYRHIEALDDIDNDFDEKWTVDEGEFRNEEFIPPALPEWIAEGAAQEGEKLLDAEPKGEKDPHGITMQDIEEKLWNCKFKNVATQKKLRDLVLFIENVVLAHPDSKKLYILRTDSSDYAVAGVLLQLNNIGEEMVIIFVSRTLRGNELSYFTTEK